MEGCRWCDGPSKTEMTDIDRRYIGVRTEAGAAQAAAAPAEKKGLIVVPCLACPSQTVTVTDTGPNERPNKG